MAKELAIELNNPEFKGWYAGVIYEFGPNEVNGWRIAAKKGNNPGRYFSTLVREARKQKAQA